MMNTATVCTWLVFACVLSCNAWGPISHYDFACLGTQQESELNCLCNSNSYFLLVGADMPDGFGFGDHEDGICDYALHMHDPIFAGYQLQWALDASINTDPDIVDMSLGYATHLIADLVGFDTTYGFLPRTRPPQYINLWFDMQIIDAMIYLNVTNNTQIPCDLPSTPLGDKGINWFAKTSYKYSQINSKFGALNYTQVAECTNRWASILDGLNALAHRTLQSTVENLIPFYDPFVPSNYQEAVQDFLLSRGCIVQAINSYLTSLVDNQATPEVAWSTTAKAVKQMFLAGQCTRPSGRVGTK